MAELKAIKLSYLPNKLIKIKYAVSDKHDIIYAQSKLIKIIYKHNTYKPPAVLIDIFGITFDTTFN